MAEGATVHKFPEFRIYHGTKVLKPEEHGHLVGNARELGVALMRDMANRLESGELEGGRCQLGRPFEEGGVIEIAMTTITHSTNEKKGEVLLRHYWVHETEAKMRAYLAAGVKAEEV